MRKQLYLSLFALAVSVSASAQFDLGVATGNWNALEALRLNPANIADCRERFSINIISGNVGVEQNLGTIKSTTHLYNGLNDGNINSIFSYSSNSRFSLLAPYAEVRLPGAVVSINHKHSVALTASIKGMNQFNNFDRSLFRTITDSTYAPTGNLDLTSNKFNYTANVWSEVGASYAGVLLERDEHLVKVGVTLKYLGGIGYLGLKGNNLDAHYKGGTADSLFVNHSDIEFASNILSTRSAVLNGFSGQSVFDEFFGSKDGHGFGADLGVVYDYMPDFDIDGQHRDNTRNRYKLRVSASVMDIGSILYGSKVNSNANVTGNGIIAGSDFSKNVSNFDDFRHYAVSHGFTADTSHRDTRVYMPTTLRIGADYKVYRNFYANALFIGNLQNREAFGNSYYNQITVTPRYDTKLFSAGLPITYSFLDHNIKAGIGFRISGFFIGSDDIMGVFANHQNSFNLYVGGFVPFYKHHHAHRTDNWDGSQLHDRSEHEGDQENDGNDKHIEIEDSTGNDLSMINGMLKFKESTPKTTINNTSSAVSFENSSVADKKNYVQDAMEQH